MTGDDSTTVGPPNDDERAPARDDTIKRGSRIGRYVVQSVLGEGGFGVVYRAEQTEPVRREVALKVIKRGMDSKAVVGRFEAERQALAMMDHPCLAKVFDGGVTEDGRPYFVMELVKGEPITDFCDRVRMPIDGRVSLFAKVCEAVQHAHSKGVVHRDLKPSNILVGYRDDDAVPMVIDFGISKALNQKLTEATVFTERGQMIGTPEYMSPEQAEMSSLDIDARSDVYSLGVVLYELLTGVRPFDLRQAGIAEMQRVIREVEPLKPSTRLSEATRMPELWTDSLRARGADARTLSSTLRRDLDWVVMKCLEKDRARRYGEATDLAAELGRFLAREPVLAGPPSLSYRVWKLLARRQWAAAAIAVVTLSVVGGTVVALSERQGRNVAQQGEREAAKEAEELARTLEEVREVRALLDEAASLEEKRVRELTAEDERVRARFEGRPADELAERLGLGEKYNGERNWVAALKHAERATELIARYGASKPIDELSALSRIGNAYRNLGRYEAAVETQRRALKLAPTFEAGAPGQIASCEYNLGNALRNMGEFDEAELLYRSSLERRREAHGEASAKALVVEGSLANLAIMRGDLDGALTMLDASIDKSESQPQRPRWLQLQHFKSFALERAGRPEEAEEIAAMIEPSLSETGGVWYTTSLCTRARAALAMGNWEEAQHFARQGFLIEVQLGGSQSLRALELLACWATALDGAGQNEAASQVLTGARRLRSSLLTNGDDGLIHSLGLARATAMVDNLEDR